MYMKSNQCHRVTTQLQLVVVVVIVIVIVIIIIIIIIIINKENSCNNVSPRDMVCLRNMCMATLNKGDNDI